MKLVAIPLADYEAWNRHWLPFLPSISRCTKESVQTLFGQIKRGEVRLTLVWDDDSNQAVALIGIRLHMRDQDLIAEICWTTGRDYKAWIGLLPELEKMLRLAGVVECRPICRPGWAKILKANGYRLTHMMMEKVL